MNAEAVIAVSAFVVAVTQLIKWAGLPDNRGPLAVLLLALFGTVVWAWSEGDFARETAFAYFAGWAAVSLSAAGTFGFTRAAANAVISASPPPNDGAGSSRTT